MFQRSSSTFSVRESVHQKLGPTLITLSLFLSPFSVQSKPRTDDLPSQQPTTAAPGTRNVTTLQLGEPVEREISGGQTHSYQIAVTAGQFVALAIQQRGIDVVEEVFAPDGKLIAQIQFRAETSGGGQNAVRCGNRRRLSSGC